MDHQLKKFFRSILELSENTWDTAELNMKTGHNVFVYGTLKRGERNHHLLGKEKFVKTCYTTLPSFTIRSLNTAFPIMFYEPDNPHSAHIMGEVYHVPSHTIRDLDQLERNPFLFTRRRISLTDFNGKTTFAFCYYGNSRTWKDELEKQGEKPFVLPNKTSWGRYYNWTSKKYNKKR